MLVICCLEMGVIKNNELVPQFHKFYMEIDNEWYPTDAETSSHAT